MPENEFLRQKREREFQQRMLAALEKPRQNRVWMILNSAFVLWLLSAILITGGGTYITGHKQCLADADQIINRRARLRQELFGRDLAYARRIADPKTFEFTVPDKRGSVLADLSNVGYAEIQAEYMNLTSRVRYADIPELNVNALRLSWLDFVSPRNDKLFDDFHAADDHDKGGEENLSRALTSQKLLIALVIADQSFEHDLDSLAYRFDPNCSMANLLGIALGYRPPIVFAAVSPSLDAFSTILRDDMKAVDKAQNDLRSFEREKP